MGARLAELRRKLGLDQAAFGELAGGVTYQTVSDWENEHSKPPRSRLRALADRLDLPLDSFGQGGPRPADIVKPPSDPWPLRGVAEGGRVRPVTVDVYVPTPSLSRGAMPSARIMLELDRIAGKMREVMLDLAELRALIPATSSLSAEAVADLAGRTAAQIAAAERGTPKVAGAE